MIRRGPRPAARPIRKTRASTGSLRDDGWRALIAPVRLAGAALMLITAAATAWLLTSHQFALAADGVEVSGVQYTDATVIRDALKLPADGAPNVFGLHTDAMRKALLALPAVAAADVHVALPDRLVVAITERTAVLQIVRTGPHGIDPVDYVLDANGLVLDIHQGGPLADLPQILDERESLGISYDVGQPIDPTESAAMLQIGALTPGLVGSTATSLEFSANDNDGFVVSSGADGWRAVFGFYTPTLRPPTIIAQQVQCLRSLLATGESTIGTIYLAPADDRCGTYLPRQSPSPT